MQFWSEEGGVRRSYPLHEGSQIIGRHLSCDVVVQGQRVSKKHLECHVEGNQVTIRDLGSSNGTMVNGAPVTSCVLKQGDEVSLAGYRLVLDTSAGGGADEAGARPAQAATFDYQPADEGQRAAAPEPAEPTAAQQPQQQDISFGDEQAKDDTPVDGSFVPQAYGAGAPSGQPQGVARDGHMYLRDPRTNREVEIVPRGAGAQADVSGYYAEKEAADKKRNTYLIAGAIAVGLLMIIALALTSGTAKNNENGRPKHAFPRSRYNELVDQSLDLMNKGEFEKAHQQLKVAHKEYSSYGVASTLGEIAKQWDKSGESADEFNWLPVESSLHQLFENRWATARVRNFASDRIKWIYDVRRQQNDANEAKKYLRADEPEKALKEFEKLPTNSTVYKKHKEQIAATRTACYTKHMRLAKQALEQMNWSGTLECYKAAGKYASETQKPDIVSGQRTARKRLKEEKVLQNANARLREDSVPALNAARKLLDAVEDGGPLAARKVELRQRIDARLAELHREKKRQVARSRYKAGDGALAISVITENKLVRLYPLRRKIEKLMKLLKEADAALENEDYELARQKYTEAATEEPSHDNAYHQRAVVQLSRLGGRERRKEIALQYNKRANNALEKNEPEAARKLYLTAMRWDPRATIGKDGLADLNHRAEVYYKQARDLRYQGRRKKAIELFEKVLRYVEEGSRWHKNAVRQLGEMRTEPPETPD